MKTPSLLPSRAPRPGVDDVGRELRATLDARRELGPDYDAQLIQRLAEQVTAHVRREMVRAPRPESNGLSANQRMALATCSLVFGIPLIVIAGTMAGPAGLMVAFATLVMINVAAGRSW
jgi:hypothetical protein